MGQTESIIYVEFSKAMRDCHWLAAGVESAVGRPTPTISEHAMLQPASIRDAGYVVDGRLFESFTASTQ